MTHINYFGINPDSIELINSDEFRAVLAAHPNLRLVTPDPDGYDTGEETFNIVILPLPEGHDDYVGVEDSDSDDGFMWVLYDDCDMVTNPSPAFIEVLKVMDAYSLRHLDSRLFMPKNDDLCSDDETVLDAEFDFATGDYKL